VGIRELRDHLTRVLDRVRRGQEVVVTDRGRPFAVIKPIPDGESLDGKLKRMAAKGLIVLPEKWGPLKPYRAKRLRGRLLSDLVIEERRSGW
jgi:prevent-host-death family protein